MRGDDIHHIPKIGAQEIARPVGEDDAVIVKCSFAYFTAQDAPDEYRAWHP